MNTIDENRREDVSPLRDNGMDGNRQPQLPRCDICRRREGANVWSTVQDGQVVRERRICDVCVRVKGALAKATACANCGRQQARKFNLRFSPGGMEMGVHLCRHCSGRQSVVDRIHRKIKGVVKRRHQDDEGSLQRDIERFLRRHHEDTE